MAIRLNFAELAKSHFPDVINNTVVGISSVGYGCVRGRSVAVVKGGWKRCVDVAWHHKPLNACL